MSRTFTLDYWHDGDWVVGRLREIPSVLSQGRDLDELTENIIDAYKLYIEADSDLYPLQRFQSVPLGIPG